MGYGIRLKVWGDYACFTRPEMKAERVSYDIITPSAARGILEAIHWKPAIRWVIDKIYILNEIRFSNIRRNEVEHKISVQNVKTAMKGSYIDLHQYAAEERQQRASLILTDVVYIIEAHFVLTKKAGTDDTEEKHYNIALRRARQGQCYYKPYFGCREFPVNFQLLEGSVPQSKLRGENDLGWMLWDIDYRNDLTPKFFRATMKDGVVDVPDLLEEGGNT